MTTVFSIRTTPIFSIWANTQTQPSPDASLIHEVGRLPAGMACHRGDIDDLDDLIMNDSCQHAEDIDLHKDTPLHIAALYGRLEIVKLLVRDHGVQVDPVNWEGWTPLFCAVSRSHIEIADFLLRSGANLNHTTQAGMSAMHVAAWFGQRDSIEFLMRRGAPLHAENVYGIIPIGMAPPGPVKRMMFNAQEELDRF